MSLSDRDLDIVLARSQLGYRIHTDDAESMALELKARRAAQAKVVEALEDLARVIEARSEIYTSEDQMCANIIARLRAQAPFAEGQQVRDDK